MNNTNSNQLPELSIAIPVYNESENILELYSSLKNILVEKISVSHEIIFIDDGSIDHSWNIISQLANEDAQVRGLRFSRNFGHQHALKAACKIAKGKAVVTIDADSQHPPELIYHFDVSRMAKWLQSCWHNSHKNYR